MRGNTIPCPGACALALIAVKHEAIEVFVKEIKEDWMVAGKELGV